jgi:Ca2+/H+ antiporter
VKNARARHLHRAIFAKQKTRNVERETDRHRNKPKEQSMEYLILVAVVSMMALYALIIAGCLKQPEW